MDHSLSVPAVSVTYAQSGTSTKSNELGMRPMQERAYQQRGEQYLLIKSPPASGKSRALMFIALDKLENQNLKQVIIVVPEKSIGSSFHNEPLSKNGFWTDWEVEPKWNLCDAPGDDGGANSGKVKAVKTFLDSDAPENKNKILVCTHATFRFAVDQFGIEALDDRLIAVDEFHHVSANPDNKLGDHIRQLMARDKTHIVAMTGSYFRGDAEAVLHPEDEAKFATVTYTYYEQLNGYDHLKQLDIGYFFYSGSYTDEIMRVLDPQQKTILHIPNVNSRESTKDKIREVEHIIEELGEFPELEAEDQEAVRQHAIAALNIVQQAKVAESGGSYTVGSSTTSDGSNEASPNTALIDGVRQYALSVTELDIDLIDRINPFGQAYAILSKSMSEERLKQVAAVIAAKRINLSMEEARELAKRALRFKTEKGRLPSITAADPWEKRMAEGIAFLQRKVKEDSNA